MNTARQIVEVETLIDDLRDELDELATKKMSMSRWVETALVFSSIVEAWGWLAELHPTTENRQEARRLRRMLLAMSAGRA